jgi:hypothetical protein
MLVADKTGVVGFIRAKSFFFPDSAARAVAGLPEILAPSGHHPAANRLSPGKPHLICTPESGGQLTAHRSDPVAQCLGLSPPGPADVVALRVCFG